MIVVHLLCSDQIPCTELKLVYALHRHDRNVPMYEVAYRRTEIKLLKIYNCLTFRVIHMNKVFQIFLRKK